MSTKYFVWKYPVKDIKNPEWVEVTGAEFYRIVKQENAKPEKTRFFKLIDDGADQDMDISVFETTKADFIRWNKEYCKKYRKRKMQAAHKRVFVSMDIFVGDDEDFTYHDIIPDESVSVEEKSEHELLLDKLLAIVETLTEEERHLLDLLYFGNKAALSERAICRENNLKRSTFKSQIAKIYEKIQKSFDQN